MRQMFKHEGTNPSSHATSGKYACKQATQYGNYGTHTFTEVKRATRHTHKQDLKNITQYEDFDTDY